MNHYWSKYLFPQFWKQDEPEADAPIKYHPEFGFEDRPKDRQLKKVTATRDELDAASIPRRLRNECAYWHIRYRGCIVHNRPFVYKCEGIKREINHCYIKERIDDMKEFERERRLNIRERKLAKMADAS